MYKGASCSLLGHIERGSLEVDVLRKLTGFVRLPQTLLVWKPEPLASPCPGSFLYQVDWDRGSQQS